MACPDCATSLGKWLLPKLAGGVELTADHVCRQFNDLGCFASLLQPDYGVLSFDDGVWTWKLKEDARILPRDHNEWVWVPLSELSGDTYLDWADEIRSFFPSAHQEGGGKTLPPL